MKNMFLSLVVLFAALSSAAIEFENKVSSDPVVIILTGSYTFTDNKRVHFIDENKVDRFRIDFNDFEFSIYNSQNKFVTAKKESHANLGSMARKLVNVSPHCPGVIKFDRNTLALLEIKSCDSDLKTIVGVSVDDCSAGMCYVKDNISTHIFTFHTAGQYTVIVPKLVPSAFVRYGLTPQEKGQMWSYLRNVTASCPVKITYNTTTLEVQKIVLECDPLALAPDQTPRG